MELKLFDKNVNVHDFNNYIDLQKAHCEEFCLCLDEFFKITDLSINDYTYYYYVATSKNIITKVYLIYKSEGKTGLALYNVESGQLNNLTCCDYDYVEYISTDAFLMKNILGKSVVVVKGKECFENLTKIQGYQIADELSILKICDMNNRVHLLLYFADDDNFLEVKTVSEFKRCFDECMITLNSERLIDSYNIGDLNKFKDSICLELLNEGFTL